MKHLVYIILFCIICVACTNNTQHYDSKNGHRISLRNPNIVIIDSCEYISWGHGLAHKGDCKYCRKYFDSLINAKN